MPSSYTLANLVEMLARAGWHAIPDFARQSIICLRDHMRREIPARVSSVKRFLGLS